MNKIKKFMAQTNQEKIVSIIFGDVPSITELNERFPRRDEYAVVTRSGPSPTGEAHIGLLYVSQMCKMFCKQNDENGFAVDGTFFLRIEDTDKSREVSGAAERILNMFNNFDLMPDEYSIMSDDKIEDVGSYGPYVQSKRMNFYKSFAKQLFLDGFAYPCFCTGEELATMREQQIETQSTIRGYAKEWAKCRNLSNQEILEKLEAGKPYVLRFKVPSSQPSSELEFRDGIKGEITITRNILDSVLLKSNGIPDYHLAHVVDDYLMGTTHVIRGDEWLNTLPFHLQLWDALGLKRPKYAHIAPIEKIDETTGERRKISKRKDPEASVQFFINEGYPISGVKEYLLNIANSNFESWRRNNKNLDISEFRLVLSKCSKSGALFDFPKLNNVCKNIISSQSVDESFEQLLCWTKQFDKTFHKTIVENEEKTKLLINLNIKRKDISNWKSFKDVYGFAYKNIFTKLKSEKIKFSRLKKQVGKRFLESELLKSESSESFFNGLKNLATEFNFSKTNQKSDSEVGTIAEFVEVVRHNICKKSKSPDLFELVKIIGEDVVESRMK